MRLSFALIFGLVAGSAFAGEAELSGVHHSGCLPLTLHGKPTFTRLALTFRGNRYGSVETLYSDPRCEVSVLETSSQGVWSLSRKNILRLRLSRMQMRPLDPRMAETLTIGKTCGKTWEYGQANEILGTSCGKGALAEYAVGPRTTRNRLELFECEGRRGIGPECTRYSMSKLLPKPLKTFASSARRRK